MRVRKADDRFVVVLIAGAVFISVLVVFAADIMRLLVGIGRKLDGAERNGRARKRMSHFSRSDQRIDVLNKILRQ